MHDEVGSVLKEVVATCFVYFSSIFLKELIKITKESALGLRIKPGTSEYKKTTIYSTATLVLVMEAVRTSETSVHFNVTTRLYIPQDFKLL
jgi:hypothetical protein